MNLAVIGAMLKNALSILAYFFNPKVREKRDRKKDWAEMKRLEAEYKKALAEGRPQAAAVLDQQMRELRAEYKYVNRSQ